MSASMIAVNVMVAALLVMAACLTIGLCRAAAAADRAQERQAAADSYEGPDSLRLLEDTEAHLDEFVLSDPDVKDGFARVDAAVRDGHEGESA